MRALNKQQLEYFKQKLLSLRREVLQEAQKMLLNLQQETSQNEPSGDPTREISWITECSLLTREQIILNAIDVALERIDLGTYGYCEETDEPIAIERLEAYPTTTLTAEAQNERERCRKIFSATASYGLIYR